MKGIVRSLCVWILNVVKLIARLHEIRYSVLPHTRHNRDNLL